MPQRPTHLDAVLRGLAANPALPMPLARDLVAHDEARRAVAARPDLTGDLIAAVLAAGDDRSTVRLARNESVPESVRAELAGHADPWVRVALATATVSRELFTTLLEDPDPLVREHLAENDLMPEDLRARLAGDPHARVRANLARWWPQAPEAVRRVLLTDPEDEVRAAACATYYARTPHPVPPPDLLPALLDDPVTRAGAVRHCRLDGALARRLAADPDAAARRQLAEHPDLPAPLRDRLAEDPDMSVALGVFIRPDTSEATRAAIFERVDAESTLDLFSDMDEAALELALNGEAARIELRTLTLPWVTADPLPHLGSPYACFRAAAARSGRLPPEAVAVLLDDADSTVRTAAALHARERVDAETAERIDRTYRPVKRTLWRPADDLPLPASTLRRLATDPDPRMRRLSPRDPDLPADLCRALANDTEPEVRQAIATHPNLPVETLMQLLNDPEAQVAAEAAANPALPQEHMHELATYANP